MRGGRRVDVAVDTVVRFTLTTEAERAQLLAGYQAAFDPSQEGKPFKNSPRAAVVQLIADSYRISLFDGDDPFATFDMDIVLYQFAIQRDAIDA